MEHLVYPAIRVGLICSRNHRGYVGHHPIMSVVNGSDSRGVNDHEIHLVGVGFCREKCADDSCKQHPLSHAEVEPPSAIEMRRWLTIGFHGLSDALGMVPERSGSVLGVSGFRGFRKWGSRLFRSTESMIMDPGVDPFRIS